MFVEAGTTGGIKSINNYVIESLKKNITHRPDFSSMSLDKTEIKKTCEKLKSYPVFKDKYITFKNNKEVIATVKDRTSFKKVRYPYTPDHIVYAGPEMLFVKDINGIEKA